MVRADLPEDALMLHGVVADLALGAAPGSTAALFARVSTRTTLPEQPGRIAIPGRIAGSDFRVEAVFQILNPERALLLKVIEL